ncbi:hypothetical protein EBU99_06530 [bacterium]|nr:hypothetical protein [bacterium]
MSNHLSSLQKWISKSDRETIEAHIAEIEKTYPLEVVVALTDTPAVIPVAAARMIALLALGVELIAESLWLPIPAWILTALIFIFLLAPVGNWYRFLPFRILARRSERQQAVQQQAEQCFADQGLARTRARNALLLFFNVKERIFCLQPDRALQGEWPELKIEEMVAHLKEKLASEGGPAAAAGQSLERLRTLATARWPEPLQEISKNELPNALVWWHPV